MSTGYVVALLLSVTVVLGSRVLLDSLPSGRFATSMTPADLALVTIGLIGLVIHCGAMFFPGAARDAPGTATVVRQIDSLGLFSVVWYLAAAGLVVIGLRRQVVGAVVAAALALIVVGVTMYDDGPLWAHLAAIFCSVLILAGVAATSIRLPWSRGSATIRR